MALAASVVVGISLFVPWYVVRLTAAGGAWVAQLLRGFTSGTSIHLPSSFDASLSSGSTGLSALNHDAGGWRWAILVLAAITVVELLMTIATTTSGSAPAWPHRTFLVLMTVVNLVLIIVAMITSPVNDLPAGLATSSLGLGAYLGLGAGLVAAAAAISANARTSRAVAIA